MSSWPCDAGDDGAAWPPRVNITRAQFLHEFGRVKRFAPKPGDHGGTVDQENRSPPGRGPDLYPAGAASPGPPRCLTQRPPGRVPVPPGAVRLDEPPDIAAQARVIACLREECVAAVSQCGDLTTQAHAWESEAMEAGMQGDELRGQTQALEGKVRDLRAELARAAEALETARQREAQREAQAEAEVAAARRQAANSVHNATAQLRSDLHSAREVAHTRETTAEHLRTEIADSQQAANMAQCNARQLQAEMLEQRKAWSETDVKHKVIANHALAKAKHRLDEATASADAERSQVVQLRSELQSAERRAEAAAATAAVGAQRADQAVEAADAERAQGGQFRLELHELARQVVQLRSELQSAERRAEAAAATAAAGAQRADQAAATADAERAQGGQLRLELQELARQATRAHSKEAHLETRVATLAQQLASSQARTRDTGAVANSVGQEVALLRVELGEAKNDAGWTLKVHEALQEQIASMKDELACSRKRAQLEESRAASRESRASQIEEKCKEARRDAKKCRAEVATLQELSAASAAESAASSAELPGLIESVEKARSEAASAEATLVTVADARAKDVLQHRAEMAEADKRAEDTRHRALRHWAEAAEAEKRVGEARLQAATAEATLAKVADARAEDVMNHRTELADAEKRVAQAKLTEINALQSELVSSVSKAHAAEDASKKYQNEVAMLGSQITAEMHSNLEVHAELQKVSGEKLQTLKGELAASNDKSLAHEQATAKVEKSAAGFKAELKEAKRTASVLSEREASMSELYAQELAKAKAADDQKCMWRIRAASEAQEEAGVYREKLAAARRAVHVGASADLEAAEYRAEGLASELAQAEAGQRERTSACEQRLAALRTELAAREEKARAEAEQYEKRVEVLTKDIEERDEAARRAMQNAANDEDQIDLLKVTLNNSRGQCERLEAEIARQKREVEQLEEKLAHARAEAEGAEAQAVASDARAAQAAQLEQQFADTKEALSLAYEENDGLNAKCEKMAQQIKEHARELDLTVRHLREENEQVREETYQLRMDNDRLQQIANEHAVNDRLEAKRGALQQEEFRASEKDFEDICREQSLTIRQFKDDFELVKRENEHLQQQLDLFVNQVDNLGKNNAQLAGHANAKQKIKYTMNISQEAKSLRCELGKAKKRIGELETYRRSDIPSQFRSPSSTTPGGRASALRTPRRSSLQTPTTPGSRRCPRSPCQVDSEELEARCRSLQRAATRTNAEYQHLLSLVQRAIAGRDGDEEAVNTDPPARAGSTSDVLRRLRWEIRAKGDAGGDAAVANSGCGAGRQLAAVDTGAQEDAHPPAPSDARSELEEAPLAPTSTPPAFTPPAATPPPQLCNSPRSRWT